MKSEGESRQWQMKWAKAVATGCGNTARMMVERDAALEELAECRALLGECLPYLMEGVSYYRKEDLAARVRDARGERK